MPIDNTIKDQHPNICQNILSYLPIPIYWLDVEGKFRGANHSFMRIAGITSTKNLLGKTAQQVNWPNQAWEDQYWGYLTQFSMTVLHAEDPAEVDLILPSLEECEDRHYHITMFPLTDVLGEKGVLVYFKDTTTAFNLLNSQKLTTKRLEAVTADLEENLQEAVQLRKEAEASNVAKSDFLANMSHELRTPLNSMLGMTEMMLLSKLDEDQYHYAGQTKKSGEHLLTLMNDILDFSKIEAGALELENRCYNLQETLYDVDMMLTTTAHKKKLPLSFHYNFQHNETMGDMARVKQVLINLIGNAIKFTEVGSVTVTVSENNNAFHFEITDTGIGIKPENIDAIFDKFTQGDTSMTRKFGGTGLGLAITKQLVRLMGGDIHVTSQEGKGSTFTVTIPYVPPQNSPESQTKERDQTTHKAFIPLSDVRLLLVEDDKLNQDVARRFLNKLGIHHIDIAGDGQECLAQYNPKKHNIILMDCQMPHMDGFEATQAIRSQEGDGEHVTIIATTANALVGDKEKCLGCGMDNYISKPVKLDKLCDMLGQYIIGICMPQRKI